MTTPLYQLLFLLQARPVAQAGPFVVHDSDAPLTVPEDPDLATDSRAVERAEFDAHMAAKMQQQEVRHAHPLQPGRHQAASRPWRNRVLALVALHALANRCWHKHTDAQEHARVTNTMVAMLLPNVHWLLVTAG